MTTTTTTTRRSQRRPRRRANPQRTHSKPTANPQQCVWRIYEHLSIQIDLFEVAQFLSHFSRRDRRGIIHFQPICYDLFKIGFQQTTVSATTTTTTRDQGETRGRPGGNQGETRGRPGGDKGTKQVRRHCRLQSRRWIDRSIHRKRDLSCLIYPPKGG